MPGWSFGSAFISSGSLCAALSSCTRSICALSAWTAAAGTIRRSAVPIVWWMFSRGEFAAFLLNCFAVPGLLLLTFPLGWYIGGDAASFITGLGVLFFVLFISPIAERLIDGF